MNIRPLSGVSLSTAWCGYSARSSQLDLELYLVRQVNITNNSYLHSMRGANPSGLRLAPKLLENIVHYVHVAGGATATSSCALVCIYHWPFFEVWRASLGCPEYATRTHLINARTTARPDVQCSTLPLCPTTKTQQRRGAASDRRPGYTGTPPAIIAHPTCPLQRIRRPGATRTAKTDGMRHAFTHDASPLSQPSGHRYLPATLGLLVSEGAAMTVCCNFGRPEYARSSQTCPRRRATHIGVLRLAVRIAAGLLRARLITAARVPARSTGSHAGMGARRAMTSRTPRLSLVRLGMH